MGLALLATIWLISFVSRDFFIAKTWWLAAGAAAVGIDRQFTVTYILMATVFVLAPYALARLSGVPQSGSGAKATLIESERMYLRDLDERHEVVGN
jgi:hypothetical protein